MAQVATPRIASTPQRPICQGFSSLFRSGPFSDWNRIARKDAMRLPKQFRLLHLVLLVLLAACVFATARIAGSVGLLLVVFAILSVAPIWFSAVCCLLFDCESGRRIVVTTLVLVPASLLLVALLAPDASSGYVNLLLCLCVFWAPQIGVIAFVSPSWQGTSTSCDKSH